MRGLTRHPAILSVWMSGLYFAVFSVVCIIWEYVMAICEFDKLYDNWCSWHYGRLAFDVSA